MESPSETRPKKSFSPLVFRYFLLLFLVSFLLLGRILWPFFSILILSFLLSGLFQPVYRFLHTRLKFSDQFSSLITCLLIKNLALILQQFLEENHVIGSIKEIFAGFGIELHPERLTGILSDFGKVAGLFLYNQASSWAANIMNFVFSFFMMVIVIFFLLIDQEGFISYILELSPLPDQQERQLFKRFEEIAKAVAFMFFGINSPILWGGVMAILAFLPIVGIGLVLVPAAIILFLKGSVGAGIFMLFFYATLSFSVEYLLKPWMVGERVKMHTLLVFLSILGGLSVYGVLGIIYGPLIVTAFLSLADIYRRNYSDYVRKATC